MSLFADFMSLFASSVRFMKSPPDYFCRSALFPVVSYTRNYRDKGLIYSIFIFLNFRLCFLC